MKLYDAIQKSGRSHELKSVALITRLLREHGVKRLGFSFNGGKDCTVLLHLIRAAIEGLQCETGTEDSSVGSASDNAVAELCDLDVLYFEESEEFAEMEQFMKLISNRYDITIHRLRGRIKQALTDFLAPRDIRAIFLGQRRVDPDSKHIAEVAPSNRGYPKFDRVNPILDWSHTDVWRFLKAYELEYCPMYDLGYTSAGPKSRTLKNPALVVDCAAQKYLSAFSLADGRMERFGRPWGKRKLESHQNGTTTQPSACIILCTPTPHDDSHHNVEDGGTLPPDATSATPVDASDVDSNSRPNGDNSEEKKALVGTSSHHHCQAESLVRQLSSLGVSVKLLVYIGLSLSSCCSEDLHESTHLNLRERRSSVAALCPCSTASVLARALDSSAPSTPSVSASRSQSPSEFSGLRSPLFSPAPDAVHSNSMCSAVNNSVGRNLSPPSPVLPPSNYKIDEAPDLALARSEDDTSCLSSASHDAASIPASHRQPYVPEFVRIRESCPDAAHTFRQLLHPPRRDAACLCKAFGLVQKHASALVEEHDFVYVCGEPVPEPRLL